MARMTKIGMTQMAFLGLRLKMSIDKRGPSGGLALVIITSLTGLGYRA